MLTYVLHCEFKRSDIHSLHVLVLSGDVILPKGLNATRLGQQCTSNAISDNVIMDGDPNTCFLVSYASYTFALRLHVPVSTVYVIMHAYGIDCNKAFHYKVYTSVPHRCSSTSRTLCALDMVEHWNTAPQTDEHLQTGSNGQRQVAETINGGQRCTFMCNAACSENARECETINTIYVQASSISEGYVCEIELYSGIVTSDNDSHNAYAYAYDYNLH